MFACVVSAALACAALPLLSAQEPPAPKDTSVVAPLRPLGPEERGEGLPPDTLMTSDTIMAVDTIVVVEELRGMVWGDWYVNPALGARIDRAIEREGKLSGRTWLQSAAPIRDLALGRPSGTTQALRFVDKGVALGFWEPGEVDYRYVFEGPSGVREEGITSAGARAERELVEITLPLLQLRGAGAREMRERVGRLDVSYQPREGSARIPRGSFTIYLYYVDPRHGWRIAGVGY